MFAMVSGWMENGNINEFVTAHRGVNRFELVSSSFELLTPRLSLTVTRLRQLGDVARGLMHMHGQGMIHGDLKGVCIKTLGFSLDLKSYVCQANILIDRAGHACLADFGLLTIASDTINITSSNSCRSGGTFRWMSPELFDHKKFDLEDDRRTKRSDCYALGMVIYEVLSEKLPFADHAELAVVARVVNGERPRRPQGEERAWFPDGIWSILESSWNPSPGHRPRIKDVLQCLEKVSRSWTSPPPQTIASPPTTNQFARNSDSSTEETTNDDEVSSQEVPPRPPHDPLPKGKASDNRIYPPAHQFPSLPYDAPGYQDLGASALDPDGSDPEELAEILGWVSWAGVLDGFWY